MTTTEKNEMIARFMGGEKSIYGHWKVAERFRSYRAEELQYNSEWNWIHPVATKIAALIKEKSHAKKDAQDFRFLKMPLCSELFEAWEAVCEWIEWHNGQTQTT